MSQTWHQELEQTFEELVAWRRDFHEHPELSFQEVRTPAKIAEILTSFGIPVKTGVGGNGVIGILKGTAAGDGPHIALRADFDALPIQDLKDVPYKSKIDGVMHACGHDGHTAALLGVARVLKNYQHELRGTVTFLFQHAEEKPPGGAISIVESGILNDVDVVFGAHLSSILPLGNVYSRKGIICASADTFHVTIEGLSSHGASPQDGIDAIAISAQIINQLQHIVSRRVGASQQVVVTVGKFHAGTAENIIADQAVFSGTVRTINEDIRHFVKNEIEHIVTTIAEAHHAKAHIEYLLGYPPLVNHEKETAIVQEIVEQHFNQWNYVEAPIGLGAEDFAYYLKEKPGSFFFVGAKLEDVETPAPHHHPLFDFDERALLNIGKLFLSIVHYYENQAKGTYLAESPSLEEVNH